MGSAPRRWLPARGAAMLAAAAIVAASCSSESGAAKHDLARPINIGNRSVYLTCAGESRSREPTIVLVSGYHDSSDVWTQSDVLELLAPAKGPAVFAALAASYRVCAYDRPGTLRYTQSTPLTDRSTPVTQPRAAGNLVTELHDVLGAAGVAPPYVLVGHSLGGLIVRLYAQTHPEQVRGVVFVDAFSPTVPSLFGARWAIYRDQLLNPPVDQMPLESLRNPASERVDLDASVAEVLAAPAFPTVPVAVLTKTASFAGLHSVPGLPADEVNQLYEKAQDDLVTLTPATPHIIATGSDHYIQFSQPDLVVRATDLVEYRAKQ